MSTIKDFKRFVNENYLKEAQTVAPEAQATAKPEEKAEWSKTAKPAVSPTAPKSTVNPKALTGTYKAITGAYAAFKEAEKTKDASNPSVAMTPQRGGSEFAFIDKDNMDCKVAVLSDDKVEVTKGKVKKTIPAVTLKTELEKLTGLKLKK